MITYKSKVSRMLRNNENRYLPIVSGIPLLATSSYYFVENPSLGRALVFGGAVLFEIGAAIHARGCNSTHSLADQPI